ncbi:MAG: hypothetical protein J6V66_05985 [Clostridia bacterium]|nr:hypothetical protein [Clostridia bacterium]
MSNGIKAKQNKDKFFTVEFWGVTIIVSAFLLLVCLLFGENVLFEIGKEVQAFILGLLGYLSYPFLLVSIFIGFTMLIGRKKESKRSLRKFKHLLIISFLFMCLLTVYTGHTAPQTYKEYLNYPFAVARGGLSTSVAGGALLSLVTYPLVKGLTYTWATVLLAIVIVIYVILLIAYKFKRVDAKKEDIAEPSSEPAVQSQQPQTQTPPQYPYGAQPYVQPQYPYGTQPYAQPYQNQPMGGAYAPQGSFQPQPMNNGGYQNAGAYGNQPNAYNNQPTFTDMGEHDRSMQILYGDSPNTYSQAFSDDFNRSDMRVDNGAREDARSILFGSGVSSPIRKDEVVKDYTIDDSFSFNVQPREEEPISEVEVEPTYEDIDDGADTVSYEDEPAESFVTDFLDNIEQSEPEIIEAETEQESEVVVEQGDEYAKRLIENMPLNYKYKKPPVSIFKTTDNTQNNYETEVFKAEVKAKILSTLKTFGIDTEIPRIFKGPAVTRFDIAVPANIPMNRVTKLQGDLNLRIAAKSAIRMIAPVPNSSYVGIEVPNKEADCVNIKDIIVSDQFINSKPFSLTFALGKDIIGNPVSLDLADMPHALVTGTTGSGKSVCLNTLIISLIAKYGPDELRFVIVDPKRVDLEPFKEIPHMMFGDIIEDVPMTNSMLTWAVEEMENRYRELAKNRSKNIKDYNTRARANGERIMPRIVIIMDEFADIMLQDKKGVATKVCLLAQKARAAGIHLVLAAQRPSVDVVEGPIKSNLPSRIVFRASSMPDSVVSLGEPGAEKLLGKGDCLYKTGGMLSIERVRGAYVSDEEMYDVIDFV